MKSVPACSLWPLQVRVDYEDVTITRLTRPRWYGAGRSSMGWKIWPDASFTRKNDFVTAISVIIYLICVLKNENNKQTVEASKRRSLDEFFFSYRFEPHSVRSYCWQWRIEHRASGMYQLREVKQRRGRRQGERQKSNRFRLAKQQLCTCITLFCTLLSRRCTATTTTW